jgi:hypothetical protein
MSVVVVEVIICLFIIIVVSCSAEVFIAIGVIPATRIASSSLELARLRGDVYLDGASGDRDASKVKALAKGQSLSVFFTKHLIGHLFEETAHISTPTTSLVSAPALHRHTDGRAGRAWKKEYIISGRRPRTSQR